MRECLELVNVSGRVFVIGDIHGCCRELSILLDYIIQKLKFSKSDCLIFVGDYIDRGPDSKAVLDLLVNLKSAWANIFFLKGNHEEMLLDYLGLAGANASAYLENGGEEFFASYALNPQLPKADLCRKMPEEHIDFLEKLERYIVMPEFVIVHAGLNPLRDVYSQRDEDIYWIRDEFLKNIHYFDKAVVFGHTTLKHVFFDLPYKIGIDTGLVYGGRLTCIELRENNLYQIEAGSKKVKVEGKKKGLFGFFR